MKTKRKLTFSDQMQTIPIRNTQIRLQRDSREHGLIIETIVSYHGMAKWLQNVLHLRRKRRYAIDGVGREVFESIDDHKTFEELIDEFADRHKLTFFEARALLMQYLQMLMSRGLVAVGVPKEPE